MKKYELPVFLVGKVTQDDYKHWLDVKARRHFTRDKKRRNITVTRKDYKESIHRAVKESQGKDAYTDEELGWILVAKYRDEDSKKGGSDYKSEFALLPTVDHIKVDTDSPEFKICSWRTNDAKNDLSYDDFIELCRKIITVANNRL